MYGVTSDNILLQLGRIDERLVLRARQQRVRKIAKEVFEKSRDGCNIVVEIRWTAEVDSAGICISSA
jgi:hypothetical protein